MKFISGIMIAGILAVAGFAHVATTQAQVKSGNYIVVLNNTEKNVPAVANEMARSHGLAVGHVYENALKGFAAHIPEARLQKLKADPRVQFVSIDGEVHTTAQVSPTGFQRAGASLTATNTASGVGVAVLDTGIDPKHVDLGGNVVAGKRCVRGGKTSADDNGHGTHVAGTIAALNNTTGVVGVSPQAKVIAVKVLNSRGSGTWSEIICGIDWVTANTAAYNIKVVNMSLSGTGSSDNACGSVNNDALHKAICNSVTAGITYVVAAGNDNTNAASKVPASYDDAVITVSALADYDGEAGGFNRTTTYGADDTFASFSNYGTVIDIGAPGVSIYSTLPSNSYGSKSGTSMAAPHVAAAAAMYIKANPGSTWTQVRDALKAIAEPLGAGHTDPSGRHPEPVLRVNSL